MIKQAATVDRLDRIKGDYLDHYKTARRELHHMFLEIMNAERRLERSHNGGDCMFVALGQLVHASPVLVRALVMGEAHFSYSLDTCGTFFFDRF